MSELRSLCIHGHWEGHFPAVHQEEAVWCPGGPLPTVAELMAAAGAVREWRCWREDGTYGGPCGPTGERSRGWYLCPHRHADCGWQWHLMEADIPQTGED